MGFFIPIAMAAASAYMGAKAAGKDGGAGRTLDEARGILQSLRAPTADELSYKVDNLVQQGVITPEQAKTFLMEKTAMGDVSTDPRLKAAQMGALSSLQDISSAGGLTTMDKAKIEAVTSRFGQEARGAREAILQRQAEMGRTGSGMELAAQLQNQQDSATRASQEGLDIAALAEQRALDAISQGGELSGQIRGQEFGEKSAIAEAKDAMDKFNLEHLRSNEEANVGRRSAADAANLSERQRVADTNVEIAGQNRKSIVDARQTAFENEMTKRKAIADALAAKAQQQIERQKQKSAFAGNLMGAAGTVGAGMLSKSDEKSKNIESNAPDMDAFMESIKPLAFKYKDGDAPGENEEENVGVIAQDVEKSKVGKTMVKNTSSGKMLDMQKGFGVILAALASLHDKYEGLEEKAKG